MKSNWLSKKTSSLWPLKLNNRKYKKTRVNKKTGIDFFFLAIVSLFLLIDLSKKTIFFRFGIRSSLNNVNYQSRGGEVKLVKNMIFQKTERFCKQMLIIGSKKTHYF